MDPYQFCLVIICIVGPSMVHGGTKGDEADVIIRNIMSGYEKAAHPNSKRDDGAVEIQIGITPLSLSVDEENSVLTSHLWLALAWQDKRLIWDNREHQNVSKVHISPENIWKPDVRLFNSVTHEDYEDTDVIVYNSGQLFWVPPLTAHTTCQLNYYYWPWDTQSCELIVGSWTKSGWEVDVVNMNGGNVTNLHLSNYASNLWTIVEARARREVTYYHGIDDPWPAIRVDLSIKRVSWLDRKIVVLPLILVSCLTLATFWTHPSSGNRILLGCFNLLVVILLLLEVQARLPQAGAQLPLVASFAGSLGVLVTIQLLMALSVANLINRTDTPPSFLIWPLQGGIAKFLCLTDLPLLGQIPGMSGYSIDVEALRAQQQNSAASEPKVGVEPPMPTLASTSRNDFSGWNLLCQAIDRVLFLSYLVIILIFIASYLGGATLASQT